MEPGQLFVKIDFRNAFNTPPRDSTLEAAAQHFPELRPFASSTIGCPSDLQFDEFVLQSEERAQQGDPLDRFTSAWCSNQNLNPCTPNLKSATWMMSV
jgi:hypothetical protein